MCFGLYLPPASSPTLSHLTSSSPVSPHGTCQVSSHISALHLFFPLLECSSNISTRHAQTLRSGLWLAITPRSHPRPPCPEFYTCLSHSFAPLIQLLLSMYFVSCDCFIYCLAPFLEYSRGFCFGCYCFPSS